MMKTFTDNSSKAAESTTYRRNNAFTEGEMGKLIDCEMQTSKAKSKSWKQLDTYLKWQALLAFCTTQNMTSTEIEHIKNDFMDGKMTTIIYDPKSQSVTSIGTPPG
jgi:hypothetical protein